MTYDSLGPASAFPSRRLRSAVTVLTVTVLIMIGAAPGYSQSSANTASLSGTVVDSSGAVIPGADVAVKNNATGVEFRTVSDEKGIFLVPSLPPGTYTVTTTLMGFKKQVIPDVVLNVATQSTVRVSLEVGGLEEVVTVSGGAEIVQTQASVIATTINVNQISNLPLVSRDAINAITMLPGVDTASNNRASTVSGLPRAAINITLDGVNTQDNNNKSTEGLFSLISPRLDATEEVTVSTATAGADSTGQGAVQIKFVTRSGTNQFRGSAYLYLRQPQWNSNYWFNNRDLPPDPSSGQAPRDQVKLTEPGFRVGGPLVHDKSFFFFNFEEFRQPSQITRQRTILNPLALQGIFQYTAGGGVRQVNLLQLAATNSQLATPDPTVARVLGDIQASTQKTGGVTRLTDPNIERFTFTNDSKGLRYYPTLRLDHNLSQNHRATFTYVRQSYDSNPDTLNSMDPSFPGFPITGSQTSTRTTWTTALRSTFTPNLVNEAHGGYTNSFVQFFPQVTGDAFNNASAGNMGPFIFSLSGSSGNFGQALTNPAPGRNTQGRENPTITVEDNLTWLRGSHSVSVGGTFTHIGLHSYTQNVVPNLTFGMATGDTALGLFNTTNFPGASTTNLLAAQQLYAILTGRITTIAANAQLDETTDQYSYLGNLVNRGQQHEFGFYAQDQWRARSNVTINYGLRYEVQLPFVARNNVFSTATLADLYGLSGVGNLFKPGVETGSKPQFVQYGQNTPLFNTQWKNFAPSVGMTWRPTARQGLLGRLIGHDEATVVRGGYALAYNRQGIGDFVTALNGNPGGAINADRSQLNGNLGQVPLLLRNTSQLGAPPFPQTPAYPLTGTPSNSVNIYDRNIATPYTHSMTIGVQRELTSNMAVEVRYVGTRNRAGWVTNNYNESVIKENGFLDEFKRAQSNLQANIAAGKGSTFAYTGVPGTSPLPIYLAFFSGLSAAQAGDPTKYTSSLWGSTDFINPLALNNPLPYVPAGTNAQSGLAGNPTRQANSITAGLPANYFRVNPDLLGGANFTTDGRFGSYDSMQIVLHKRLSNSLQVEGNYVLANAYDSALYSLRIPRQEVLSIGDTGGIHHAVKFNWVYELPFGRGKRWAATSGLLDRIVGGWGFDGSARIQSGELLSFGNVRLVGMTVSQLQDTFHIRKDDAGRVVYMLPQDIIDNTIKAFSTSATSASGYGANGPPTGRYMAPANSQSCIQVVIGDCAPPELYVTGPKFIRVDLSAVKRVAIARGVNFEFRAEFLNAFNNVDFVPTTAVPSGTGGLAIASGGNSTIGNVLTNNTGFSSQQLGQVTSAYRDSNNTQDPGGRLVQLVFRITW